MAVATKRSQMTLEALNQLGALANSKIGGGPYTFTKPVYVVRDSAHLNSVASYHRTIGYFLQEDVAKVFTWNGSGWSDTGMRVFSGATTPTVPGAPGEMAISYFAGVARKITWRPEYPNPNGGAPFLRAGWYGAHTRQIIETIRSVFINIRSRGFSAPLPNNFKDEHFIFGYQGQPGFNNIMPFSNGINIVNENGRTVFRSDAVLGNISYIHAESASVTTQVLAGITLIPQWESAGGGYLGDRNRLVAKFRLRHPYAGRLVASFNIFGYPNPSRVFGTWEIRSSLGFTQTPVSEINGQIRLDCDAAWGGEETRVECVYTPPAGSSPNERVDSGASSMAFYVEGQAPVASDNTIGGEGFESVAVGCAMAGGLPGPEFEEGFEHPSVPMHESFDGGWRERNGQSAVTASKGGGIWRAIPFALLGSVGVDPIVFIDRNRSYFAPRRDEQVSGASASVNVGVESVIARYPFLKTTDNPNRRVIAVEIAGFQREPFTGGGSIYSVSAHRVKEGSAALSVKVGYVTSGGEFRSKATLSIPSGSRDSEVIYPGWWVMPNIGGVVTMAYECSEVINIQALWTGQQRFSNPFDPHGAGAILPDANTSTLTSPTAAFSFIFNDLEAALQALP